MNAPVSFASLATLLLTAGTPCQDRQPGLFVTFGDGTHEIVQTTPSPRMTLGADESVHPQLGTRFRAEWTGFLRVEIGGRYTIRSNARVELGGRDVTGKPQRVAAGDHPIRIVYERVPGPSTLWLTWETEQFPAEPIPSRAFVRAPTAPAGHAAHARIERGRFLFEELSCSTCHEAAAWDQVPRRGPNLSNVGARLSPTGIRRQLQNPAANRSLAVMPQLLHSEAERRDVAAFLDRLVAQRFDAGAELSASDLDRGKELYESVGCTRCHTNEQRSLEGIDRKFASRAALADFLRDPLRVDSSGRMPQLFDPVEQADEARFVAAHLFRDAKPASVEFEAGDPKRGRELFEQRRCNACHEVAVRGKQLAGPRPAPAFTRPKQPRLIRQFATDGATAFDGKRSESLEHVRRPDAMTAATWVRTTGRGVLLSWGSDGRMTPRGTRELRVGHDGAKRLTYGEFNDGMGWRAVTRMQKGRIVNDGKWHHVAVVVDGARVQLFVDGERYGKPGRVHAPGPGYTNAVTIGGLRNGGGIRKRFQGELRDLAVWDAALTARQVAALAKGKAASSLIEPPKGPPPTFDVSRGCLAERPPAGAPRYVLSAADRASLRDFLASMRSHPPRSNAPLHLLERRIEQLSCTTCHSWHAQNGAEEVRFQDDAGELPPPLTTAGEKLREDWTKSVLTGGRRVWHWFRLRMPHYGNAVHGVAHGLAATAGVRRPKGPAPGIESAKRGLRTIGAERGAVACIVCHEYRGIDRKWESVSEAPDLALAAQSMHREWFQRWMRNPSRVRPGTSMPQFWNKESPAERERRIDDIWSAIALQDQLPLPNGLLERRTRGTQILVGAKPVVFRAATEIRKGLRIDRAINVGLPGGWNYTFDARTASVRHAWRGEFVNAAPAWNGRGGKPVRASGTAIYTPAEPYPIRVDEIAKKPQVRFRGFDLESGTPVFRFEVDGVPFRQRITASDAGLRFEITKPKTETDAWFVAEPGLRYTSSPSRQRDRPLLLPKDATRVVIQVHVGGDK